MIMLKSRFFQDIFGEISIMKNYTHHKTPHKTMASYPILGHSWPYKHAPIPPFSSIKKGRDPFRFKPSG